MLNSATHRDRAPCQASCRMRQKTLKKSKRTFDRCNMFSRSFSCCMHVVGVIMAIQNFLITDNAVSLLWFFTSISRSCIQSQLTLYVPVLTLTVRNLSKIWFSSNKKTRNQNCLRVETCVLNYDVSRRYCNLQRLPVFWCYRVLLLRKMSKIICSLLSAWYKTMSWLNEHIVTRLW